MHPIIIARTVLFSVLVLFCFIALGISGALLTTFSQTNIILIYAQLSVAVSVLSLVVLIPTSIIELVRKNAFTSMVAVEISWSFVLMILWAAAAGLTTGEASSGCQVGDSDLALSQSQCSLTQGLAAAGWFCLLILMGWNTTLFVFALMAHNRGNSRVWTLSVTGENLTAYHSPSMAMNLQNSYSQQSLAPMQYQDMPMQKQQMFTQQQQMPMQQQQYPQYSQGYPPAAFNPGPPQQQYPFAPSGAAQV